MRHHCERRDPLRQHSVPPGEFAARGDDGPGKPILELRHAQFAHRRERAIFEDVSVGIDRGAKIALLGANGSGKTTLLRLLIGIEHGQRGELLLEGRRVGSSRSERTRLRRSVQMVLQEPDDQVFSATVRADVGFGPLNMGLEGAEVAERIEQAMEAVGITELADRAPHLLSFGQRKRVALAGVLAMRPAVMLLDEPTAGLDPAAVDDLMTILNAVSDQGVAVVLATHEVDLAWQWAEEVLLLTEGSVLRAPAREVLADPALLATARLRLPWGAAVSILLNRTVFHPGEI